MRILKSLSFLMLLATLAVGCGSSSKKKADTTGDTPVSADSERPLELNADSDSGKAGAISTVFFDFNSSSLGSDARSTLDANAEFLKSNTSVEIQVEGHCDERGGVQYNLALGEKRAKTVKDYLVALGVASKRVTTISFGKERPIAFGHDESSWGQNRRGNFVITAK
jgi:peptidoglycan-associated lipoprotein